MKKNNKLEMDYCDFKTFVESKDLNNEEYCILFSSEQKSYSGKYSVLGLFPREKLITDDYSNLEKVTFSNNEDYFSDGYFGYFSYDLKNSFEKLPFENESYITAPKIMLYRFHLTFVFKHEPESLFAYFSEQKYLDKWHRLKPKKKDGHQKPFVKEINSNFSKDDYINAVKKIREYIIEGDIFEANLTRKFFGKFVSSVNEQDLFWDLIKNSPSQYSAFFNFSNLKILSSSPERFVKIKNSFINSKPIKGTQRRGKNPEEDLELRDSLYNSEKDRSENLMIVDLVRNDLGRIAKTGSVKVDGLFEIESYETVHQMVSSINAQIKEELTIWDAIKSCFPPGSMTGAPKIRAMEICSEIEKMKRGIYSGALGYIGMDSYVDLSVIIRTLIISDKKFEFQVGGAIVYDSDPLNEYYETLLKGKAIAEILGLNLK